MALLMSVVSLTVLGAAAAYAQGPAKSASQKNLRLRGLMTYDNAKDVNNFGVYDYTATAPVSRKQVVSIPRVSASGGSVVRDNILYYYDYAVEYGYVSSATYYKYDLAANKQLSSTSVGYDVDKAYNNAAMSVATDPTTGTVYCCNFHYDTATKALSYVLATWDLEGMAKTVVAPLDAPLRVLACTADGRLYGITASTAATGAANNGGMLVSVDKTTGKLTKIGDTGVRPGAYFQAATIDAATGVFYWFANEQDEAANLYTVNLTTGAATKVGALPNGDQVVCAYVPHDFADGVPSPAEKLQLAFTGGALTGTVSFAIPTDTYSGALLSGDVTYTVTANGQTVATGTAKAGATVSAPVTLAKDGVYTIAVTLTNGVGASPVTDASQYVGYDTPEAVTNVRFARTGTTNTVSWTAPAKGVNGGYIDASALTYEITRVPDGKVATTQATTFAEDFDSEELGSYSYKVVAVNGTHKSTAVTSNAINIGTAVVPPFADDFSNATTTSLYTIVDANADGSKWAISGGSARYRYNAKNDADDWFILPPLKLQAGKSYKLTYTTWVTSARSEERMEVRMGQAATAEAMTATLKETQGYTATRTSPAKETIEIMPEADGVYYIGFHAVSEKNKGFLYLDNIAVSAGQSVRVPARVADLSVKPADKGALSATIAFTVPTQNAAGQPLTGAVTYTVKRGTTQVATAAQVAPGAQVSVIDQSLTAAGKYTYSVVLSNADGDGAAAEATAYVGPDTPLSPATVHVTDQGDGTAVVAWTATEATGANGGYVDVASTLYDVKNRQGITVAKDVQATQVTVNDIDITGTQAIAYFTVQAHNAVGKAAKATTSDTIIVGKSYDVPFVEKFDGAAYTTTLWTTATLAGKSYNGKWDPREDADVESDGGYADFGGYAAGSKARLQSPKIATAGAQSLTLSFSSIMPTGNMKLAVEVSTDNGAWRPVADVPATTTWTTHTLTLSGLEDARTLRVGFVGECVKDINFIYVDNVKVEAATVGISVPLTDGAISIDGNSVTVTNATGALIQVCTTAGQVVAQGRGSLHCTAPVAGVYVVRNGNNARTVVIR